MSLMHRSLLLRPDSHPDDYHVVAIAEIRPREHVHGTSKRGRELTGNAAGAGAAAGGADQDCRCQIPALAVSCSGPQLTLCSSRGHLTPGTGCVAVPILDGSGRGGRSSGHEGYGGWCVVGRCADRCQADAINAAGPCAGMCKVNDMVCHISVVIDLTRML